MVIEGTNQVTLWVDDVPKLSYQFATDVTDGAVGVGTRDAISRFDNVSVQPYVAAPPPPPATLPLSGRFCRRRRRPLPATVRRLGCQQWRVSRPPHPRSDGISTVTTADLLPDSVRLAATVSADPAGANVNSNGLLIFDYQSPTDFRFAGAYAGADRWVIGHRTASTWVEDASLSEVDRSVD